MKNALHVVKAVKAVVGSKEARHVFKAIDMLEQDGLFQAAVDCLVNGEVVGIQPRTPVNKKFHVEEATRLVADLNGAVDKVLNILLAPAPKKTKTKKEVESPMKKQFGTRDAWAEAKTTVSGSVQPKVKSTDRAHRNAAVGSFQKHAIEVANQRYRDFGQFEVQVVAIEWYKKPKINKYYPEAAPKMGLVKVILPRGYAATKWINMSMPSGERVEWHEFGDYSLTQLKSAKAQFNPAPGSGELTLEIKENKNGQLYVTLPKGEAYVNQQDQTVYPDRLRTRDVRFPDNEPHSGNNANLEANITAFIRFFSGEFVQANPINRHGIDEHCGTCKFNMYVPGHDQDDRTEKGHKNTLNTNDTIEMVQWGQEIPRRFCMVNQVLTDLDVVKEINEALQKEENTYFDENSTLRFLRDGEIIINGRGIHRLTAIKQGTAERCAACPHYHNNAPKSDEQIGKEKAAGATYVSKYWSEDARADRVAIQTLIHDGRNREWVNQYPGEVERPLEFRVYGIGGLIVSGNAEVNAFAMQNGVLNQIPMMEEVNRIEERAAKVTNYIHQACNRFSDVSSDTLDNIFKLIDKKPEGMSARMERRWNGAVERLVATIEEARSDKQ